MEPYQQQLMDAPVYGEREYSAWENLGAMFEQENLLGSAYLETTFDDGINFELPGDDELMANGWVPRDMLEGMDGVSDDEKDTIYSYIYSAETPAEARKKMRLYRERKDNLRTLQNMSLTDSLWTGALAGITDPVVLGSIALTGGWGGMLAGGALRAGARVGAIATAEQGLIEAGLHSMQPERTYIDTLTNTVAAATIGGVMGAGFSRLNRSPQLQQALDEHETALTDSLAATRFEPDYDEAIPFQPEASSTPSVNVAELSAEVDRIRKEGGEADLEASIAARKAYYEALDAETTPYAERGLVKGLNMATRFQTSPLATIREAGAVLHGGSLATKGNVAGEAGIKVPAPVEYRIEAALGRVNEVAFVLDKYRKDFYGSNLKGAITETYDAQLDRLASRIMRSDGVTMDGPNGPVKLTDWQQRMYKDLEEIEQVRYDMRYRKGYFADIIRRNGWDVESLEKSIKKNADDFNAKRDEIRQREEKGKITRQEANDLEAKLRIANQIEGDKMLGLLEISKKASKGSRSATDELIKLLHGDKRYMTQAYNTARLKEIGEGEFVRIGLAATKKKLNRLVVSDHPAFMKAEYQQRLDNWNEEAETSILKAAYKTLSSEQSQSFGGMEAELLETAGTNAPLPSSMKTRQLMVEQDDFEMAGLLDESYTGLLQRSDRQALPYIELKNAGMLPGSKEFNALLKSIDDEVDIRTYGMSSEEKAAFMKKVEKAKADLMHSMDMLRYQEQKDVNHNWRTWASNIKALQVVRALGGVIFSNLADLGSNIMKNGGIVKMSKGWSHAMKRQRAFVDSLTTEDAAVAAGIYEMVAATTMHRMANDVDGGLELGKWSTRLGNATNKFMKWTLLPWLNQHNKVATIFLAEDRLLNVAMGRITPDKHDVRWLAQNGWSKQKLASIRRLHERYPINEDGAIGIDRGLLRQKYNADPDNPELIADMDFMDELGAFSNWISSKNVVTPGAPDMPNFIAKSPLAQMVFQFKSFSFASVDRTLNPMIQGAVAGDFRMLEGAFAMWALAIGGYMLRQKAYNREISDNPTQIAYEGLLRSGMLPLLAEGTASFQKMTGNFFGAGEALGLEPLSRFYARDPITEWVGPAFGMIQEFGSSISNANFKLANGEQLTQQDYAKLARLLPYQNLFYLRAMIEYFYDR